MTDVIKTSCRQMSVYAAGVIKAFKLKILSKQNSVLELHGCQVGHLKGVSFRPCKHSFYKQLFLLYLKHKNKHLSLRYNQKKEHGIFHLFFF